MILAQSIKLPEMVVEKRDPESAHRVPAPDLSKENISLQLQQAIQLNDDAKGDGWAETTLEVIESYINKYMECSKEDIMGATKNVFGFYSFREVAVWVQDDACSEVFNYMLKYCLNEGQPHKKAKDFIDGSGLGYLNLFRRNLKENIEKTFDAKYFYKVRRPLQYVLEDFGMDLSRVANKVHPGHWSYPQGHSTKSFTALQTVDEVFHLDKNCYKEMFIAACVFGHGRDGNLIHLPMDTYGSGYNTELKEFAEQV